MVSWLQSSGWVDFFVGFDMYFSFPKMEHLKFIVIAKGSGFLFRDKLAVTFFRSVPWLNWDSGQHIASEE